MKIGIDARFAVKAPRRGIGTYSLNLISELMDLDRRVEFILYIDRDDIEGTLPSGSNVQVRRLRPSFYPLWEQLALPVAAWHDDLDLFHALGNTGPLWLPSRTELVLSLMDVMFLQSGEFIPMPHTIYQRAGRAYRASVCPSTARRSARVITISEFSRQDILKLVPGIPCQKVAPIYLACDPRYTHVNQLSNDAISRPFLLCLGAEDPRKNTQRIVQAYLGAIKNHDIAHDLLICGYANWGNSKAYRLVKEANAEARVRFHSFISVEELLAFYQQSTALLYLSLYEGFGIPILEAFACGCPVIASSTTSIPEVGGDAAIYVDPCDVAEIESAIVRVCTSSALHSELRSRGLDRVTHFSWAETARKTMAVYLDVINRSRVARA